MHLNKSHRLFISISLVLAISDLLLVVLSGFFSERDLRSELEAQGHQYRATYNLILDEQYASMLMLANTFARQERIQQLFAEGALAVEEEGGDGGGVRAQAAREALYALVGPAWNHLIRQFDVRQLHFHLGPGSTSFLRTHRPEKFGDNMDDIRHIIVDVNRGGEPRTGFETGRVYSGIRGVVPMFASNETGAKQVGALEVGTSFQPLLDTLARELQVNWAILLTREHVESTMWPDFIRTHFKVFDDGCLLESTTHKVIHQLIAARALRANCGQSGTHRTELDGTHYAVHYWPLRDYRGQQEPNRPAVGTVVAWQTIDQRLATYRQSRQITLIYAIVAYLLVELMLFFAIRLGTRRLEREVAERTREVESLNQRLLLQANTDALTGLSNRRHLLEHMEQEYKRATRHAHPFSLLIIDLDLFKRVNDRHGHQTGDAVLRHVAVIMQARLRSHDLLGRYGGEEFCIVLPDTDSRGARSLAEALRVAVADHPLAWEGKSIPITLSIGLAEWDRNESLSRLLGRADTALYLAKERGRNRSCEADDCGPWT